VNWYEHIFSLISIYLVVAAVAAFHVLLNKRNSRSAFGWLGLIIVFPIAGALLYALFGINRVRRKAQRASREGEPGEWKSHLGERAPGEAALDLPGFGVTGQMSVGGHSVRTFYDGEEAYPAMLDAIDSARREVLLSTYIFDNDRTGLQFADRLARARERGCTVSIIIDDVGIRYSLPTIIRELKSRKLAFRRFMPLKLFPPSFSINLRTHRKLLIVDRERCFAGGMNIGDRQLAQGPSPHRASDLHFSFKGPVVQSFVQLFDDDWHFAHGSSLDSWAAEHPAQGSASCRLISDGPDETLDSLMLVIMGAISCARRRVWIMTPYFLPERQMMGCLQAAALSGVDIRIMIPEKNNWPLVQWALQHNMAELLDVGVRLMQRPPPFAHSKCMIVDDGYVMVGSSNLDPRSLRLNFELGVEVFDTLLNRELSTHFTDLEESCITITRQRLRERGYAARLRDGAAALFSPYL
jgi:cardiolipin synthase